MSQRETYKSCVKSIEKYSLCIAANSYTNKYEGLAGALCYIVVLCVMKLMEGRWDLTFCTLLHSMSKSYICDTNQGNLEGTAYKDCI